MKINDRSLGAKPYSREGTWKKHHREPSDGVHARTILLQISGKVNVASGVLLRHKVIHQVHSAILAAFVVQKPPLLLLHGCNDMIYAV